MIIVISIFLIYNNFKDLSPIIRVFIEFNSVFYTKYRDNYIIVMENGIYWIAYIVDNLIKECLTESEDNCLGCKDNKSSAILHHHLQLGLRDKLEYYLYAATIKVDVTLEDYLTLFSSLRKLKLTDLEKASYITHARKFLKTCTPGSIYYGNYITGVYDEIINKVDKT